MIVGTANGQEIRVPRSGVETVDRADQPDRRHLHQVILRLTALAEPSRDVAGHRQELGDQLVAQLHTARIDFRQGVANSANNGARWA